MIQTIDHIGIAVRSLEERVPFYRDVLGLGEPEIETVTDQRVRTAVFRTPGNSGVTSATSQTTSVPAGRIELLEPTDDESPIARFLEKNGEGIHHIALGVDNVAAEITTVSEAGLRMIDETPRSGVGGTEIAFVHPKSTGGVLMEFCSHGNEE